MYWDATYQVTTPLFLGGAKPEDSAELRPPSIKGLLRFWFRAIVWPRLQNWEKVQDLENKIFGCTKNQASFLLTIQNQEGLSEIKSDSWPNLHGLRYLGYGVTSPRGDTVRPYLKPGGRFTIRIHLKKESLEDAVHYLPLTLQALGLFGAAGARSRKGFGSLSLESLTCNGEEIWKAPDTVEELNISLQTLLREINVSNNQDSRPEYTAFSSQSRVWIALTGVNALNLLDSVGYELLSYRSYGRESKGKHVLPGGKEAEQNFSYDHDLMLNFCRGNQIKKHPERVVFGLPHNYFFKSTRDKIEITPTGKDYNRRASPLFFHIHALNQRSYATVITLLPAVFIPSKEEVEISSGRHKVPVYCNVDYNHIVNFMNRPAFSQSKVVVWP
ncbi:MAG: type III-B CRISPR module RAMP protein Cmr1 [Dethiobacteria bacterium]|mgnify:CR=1 FL=1